MKRRYLVTLILFIISGFSIYYIYTISNIYNKPNSKHISILYKGNKVSNLEVNNINQKLTNLGYNIASDEIVSDKNSLVKLILQNIILGKDTIVTIKDSSIINNINILANTVAEDYGYSGYISDINYEIRGNTAYLHFDYKNGKDYFLNCINAVNSKVNSIVAQIITPSMSDFDKELAIHNYVVNNVKYDYNRLQNNTLTVDDFTAYGALINGISVCEGYSEAIYRLLNAANINNYIIRGTGNNIKHAWNIAKIKGNYYHLDATFDDPVTNYGPVLSYGYFNLPDSQISVDHAWDTSRYPKCESTSENYYVSNHLIANNRNDFYNIVSNGLLKKQAVIRLKTYRYDETAFDPQIVFNVVNDKKISYVNINKGVIYDYNKDTCEMQIFITYI